MNFLGSLTHYRISFPQRRNVARHNIRNSFPQRRKGAKIPQRNKNRMGRIEQDRQDKLERKKQDEKHRTGLAE